MLSLPRRKFLTGLLAAPVVITTPGLLMRVKHVPIVIRVSAWRPVQFHIERYTFAVDRSDAPAISDIVSLDYREVGKEFVADLTVDRLELVVA